MPVVLSSKFEQKALLILDWLGQDQKVQIVLKSVLQVIHCICKNLAKKKNHEWKELQQL